jgi:hypothetical protein
MENNATVLPFVQKPKPNQLRCTKCGVTQDAACDCGVPYDLIKPSALAKIGLHETPGESNRAIAKRMDISDTTVRKVREIEAEIDPVRFKNARTVEPIWNDERDAEMMRLLEEGYSYTDVGVQMDTTSGAISGRLARLEANKLDPKRRGLPEIMPDDVLAQADEYFRRINIPMHDLESLTMYANQMHEDAKHAIAEYLKIIGDLSKSGIKRLIGDPRDIKPPQCGVRIRIHKDEE